LNYLRIVKQQESSITRKLEGVCRIYKSKSTQTYWRTASGKWQQLFRAGNRYLGSTSPCTLPPRLVGGEPPQVNCNAFILLATVISA
jgi:hypothetical protein